MRIDLYTKVVLTIIALLLAVITVRPMLQPHTVVAQGKFTGVEFSTTAVGGFYIFDPRSGDVWGYGVQGEPVQHYKLTTLGEPLK